MNYARKNLISLKQVNTSLSNKMKFENTKSSVPLKRFIARLSTTVNSRKRASLARQNRVLRNLRKNKDIAITKPDKGNRIVILDLKLYDNTIQEIISDTSKFEKLHEELTLTQEASL